MRKIIKGRQWYKIECCNCQRYFLFPKVRNLRHIPTFCSNGEPDRPDPRNILEWRKYINLLRRLSNKEKTPLGSPLSNCKIVGNHVYAWLLLQRKKHNIYIEEEP